VNKAAVGPAQPDRAIVVIRHEHADLPDAANPYLHA